MYSSVTTFQYVFLCSCHCLCFSSMQHNWANITLLNTATYIQSNTFVCYKTHHFLTDNDTVTIQKCFVEINLAIHAVRYRVEMLINELWNIMFCFPSQACISVWSATQWICTPWHAICPTRYNGASNPHATYSTHCETGIKCIWAIRAPWHSTLSFKQFSTGPLSNHLTVFLLTRLSCLTERIEVEVEQRLRKWLLVFDNLWRIGINQSTNLIRYRYNEIFPVAPSTSRLSETAKDHQQIVLD